MFSLAIYFIHRINGVYVSIPISQFLPLPPSRWFLKWEGGEKHTLLERKASNIGPWECHLQFRILEENCLAYFSVSGCKNQSMGNRKVLQLTTFPHFLHCWLLINTASSFCTFIMWGWEYSIGGQPTGQRAEGHGGLGRGSQSATTESIAERSICL